MSPEWIADYKKTVQSQSVCTVHVYTQSWAQHSLKLSRNLKWASTLHGFPTMAISRPAFFILILCLQIYDKIVLFLVEIRFHCVGQSADVPSMRSLKPGKILYQPSPGGGVEPVRSMSLPGARLLRREQTQFGNEGPNFFWQKSFWTWFFLTNNFFWSTIFFSPNFFWQKNHS